MEETLTWAMLWPIDPIIDILAIENILSPYLWANDMAIDDTKAPDIL